MISCHVSEKWKIGPVMPQIIMTLTAAIKAQGDPTIADVLWANLRNRLCIPHLIASFHTNAMKAAAV
jgi:hypothetical protein